MDLTQDFINQEVRRVVFSFKRPSGEFIHLFSILEKVDNSMLDYNDFTPNYKNEFNAFLKNADGCEDKLFLTVDRIKVTKELFDTPWEDYYSGEKQLLPIATDYHWPAGKNLWRILPSDADYKSELSSIIPRRECPKYVRYCIPQKHTEKITSFLSNPKLIKQLRELSLNYLGYDLSIHKNFFGGFIFLTYNNVYKYIGFAEKETNDGIYCRVHYKHKGEPLSINCKLLSQDNGVVGEKHFLLDGSRYLYELNFGGQFHSLELSILDKDNDLLDFFNRLTFIHSINFDMRIVDQEVNVLDEDGNTIKTVHKCIEGDRSVIGEKDPTKGLLDSSPEYYYQEFEKALDFVFYDGDKDSSEQNIKKSSEDILRILNSAHERIYICDVFFDVKSLNRFIIPMESRSVKVKILSGKKELKKDRKRDMLMKAISAFNGNGIANIECRLMLGKKAELHDRFIVADNQVWMLGCSLNEFGNRATTLIRVPKDYKTKLIVKADQWWNDDSLTEDINKENEIDFSKRKCFLCKWFNKLCRG